MALRLPAGMQIMGQIKPGFEKILPPDALALVAKRRQADTRWHF
jgi:malate synthase